MASAAFLSAEDWPGYLGPNRDGTSTETDLLHEWPGSGPSVLWRTPIGPGYSSVAVVDGHLFTLFAKGDDEWLAAFNTVTGKEVWRARTGGHRKDSQGSGPRSTPSVADGVVYAVGATAELIAVDAATGERRWGYDLAKDFGAKVPSWGVSSSPLIEGELLIIHGGGRKRAFLAFDKATGEPRWTTGSSSVAYASPIAATIGGGRQVIFFGAEGLAGVAVEDGRALWKAPWRTRYDVNAATPLFVPQNGLFVSSGYDTGGALLQIVSEDGDFEARQIWRSRVMRNEFNTSVRVDRHVYGFDDGILKSVDVLSGEESWRGRAGSKGSLIAADGHLFVLGGTGELSLVEATPEEFRKKASVRMTRERTWAVPALAAGVLYLRAWDELIALRVGAQDPG